MALSLFVAPTFIVYALVARHVSWAYEYELVYLRYLDRYLDFVSIYLYTLRGCVLNPWLPTRTSR
jgi:hypothetical protein